MDQVQSSAVTCALLCILTSSLIRAAWLVQVRASLRYISYPSFRLSCHMSYQKSAAATYMAAEPEAGIADISEACSHLGQCMITHQATSGGQLKQLSIHQYTVWVFKAFEVSGCVCASGSEQGYGCS